MADNFLEKRMDDYARGKIGVRRTASRGLQCIKIPAVRVLMVNADGQELIVKALCEAGYKVAFTLSGQGDGNRMAQATGGRFYPGDASRALQLLADSGDSPAAVVAPTEAGLPSKMMVPGDSFESPSEPRTILLDAPALAGQPAHVVALLLIGMLHPDYANLT